MDNREDYRLYLMELIRPFGSMEDPPALLLFRALDEVPFTVTHSMDNNRIADAMNIRSGYGYFVDGPVTLLEIMVELSLYLAYAREKLIPESDPWRWFSEMANNAGIYEGMRYEEIVDQGNRVVSSEVSMFPLDDEGEDNRGMELWMQLNRYLVKRYHA